MGASKTKKQIIAALAKQSHITNKQCETVLDNLAKMAYSEAENGFRVPGICKLQIVDRKARVGRNPRTGEKILIKKRKALKIDALKKACDAILPAAITQAEVSDLPPEQETAVDTTVTPEAIIQAPPVIKPDISKAPSFKKKVDTSLPDRVDRNVGDLQNFVDAMSSPLVKKPSEEKPSAPISLNVDDDTSVPEIIIHGQEPVAPKPATPITPVITPPAPLPQITPDEIDEEKAESQPEAELPPVAKPFSPSPITPAPVAQEEEKEEAPKSTISLNTGDDSSVPGITIHGQEPEVKEPVAPIMPTLTPQISTEQEPEELEPVAEEPIPEITFTAEPTDSEPETPMAEPTIEPISEDSEPVPEIVIHGATDEIVAETPEPVASQPETPELETPEAMTEVSEETPTPEPEISETQEPIETPAVAEEASEDSFLLACGSCGQEVEASLDMVGMEAECPACAEIIVIVAPCSPAPAEQQIVPIEQEAEQEPVQDVPEITFQKPTPAEPVVPEPEPAPAEETEEEKDDDFLAKTVRIDTMFP